MTGFHRAVRAVVAAVPAGSVLTYGEVAAEAGHPGAARAVGTVLRDSDELPWWRVVRTDGRLVPGHEARQAALLAREGVATREGRLVALRSRRPGPGVVSMGPTDA